MSGAASEVSVVVERLGHKGDGIAPGPVYAPRTLPGEVVTGVLSGDRIEKPRIETPSPDRVSPQTTAARPPLTWRRGAGGRSKRLAMRKAELREAKRAKAVAEKLVAEEAAAAAGDKPAAAAASS